MADIFVSYARADRARVEPLIAALEAQGFSVWWDPEIVGGQEFDALITRELEAAKVAVVVWTPASVNSRWVRGEARFAADRGVLTPIQLDAPSLPLDFRAIHTIDFDSWDGDVQGRPFQDLTRALGAVLRPQSAVQAPEPASPRPHGVSICVLPFANMSRDDDQEYFADGISEDIITDLSKVSALSVIARNTAFTFKGRSVEVPQVARQLKVTHVLEGSVRKAGGRVRITAQLIDGAAGDHVWAERYDRDLDDIFALQDEISQAIVSALKVKLLPEEKQSMADRGTTNLKAYDRFMRARSMGENALTGEDFLRAVAECQEVLAIDPDFAEVRAEIAVNYQWYSSFAPKDRERTIRELETLVREALARAPDHWASQLANGVLLGQGMDWAGAEGAHARARAAAPPSEVNVGVLYALRLTGMGRVREGVAFAEAARDADPLSARTSFLLQDMLFCAGRTAEASAEYERTAALTGSREPREHTFLFQTWETGDMAQTKRQFRRYLDQQVLPNPVLAKILEVIDDPPAALRLIAEAMEDPDYQDGLRMMVLALYAAKFGDDELAVKALRRCYVELVGTYLMGIWYPTLSRARRTPAFKDFVRDLGLSDHWRASGNWGDFARPIGEDDFEIYR
jgi:adenylate cyclase